jgi:signal transduction histidine kinase
MVRVDGADPAVVKLSVSNAGTVPENLLPVIWEPFQRGEARDRRTGLGLGLFITREIATAHGGTVELTTGGGTTLFTLSLPRGKAATTAAAAT